MFSRLERQSSGFVTVCLPRPRSLSVRADTPSSHCQRWVLCALYTCLWQWGVTKRVDTWPRTLPTRDGSGPVGSVTGILLLKHTWLYLHFSAVLFPFLKSSCYLCLGKEEEKGRAFLAFPGWQVQVQVAFEKRFIHVTRATGHFLGSRVEITDQGSRLVLSKVLQANRVVKWETEEGIPCAWRER